MAKAAKTSLIPDHVNITKHLTYGQAREEMEAAEAKLLDKNRRHRYTNDGEFHNLWFHHEPGVYAVFLGDDKPVYVGQSTDLRKRMSQFSVTRLHTFRRSFGRIVFKDHPDIGQATAKSFPRSIELELDVRMTKAVSVSYAVVRFGRIEVEDFMIRRHKPVFNTTGNRR